MYDLDPKVKVIGKKAGICDGVPSTAALVIYETNFLRVKLKIIFSGQFYVQDAQKNHLIETTDVWHRSEMICIRGI